MIVSKADVAGGRSYSRAPRLHDWAGLWVQDDIGPDAAGPGEHGRDFVVEDVDRLGLSRTLIVQVKSWSGSVGDEALHHGLDQLRRGVEAESGAVDMAILLTLADELPRNYDVVIETAQRELGTRIRVLQRDQTLDLMLDHIGLMAL